MVFPTKRYILQFAVYLVDLQSSKSVSSVTLIFSSALHTPENLFTTPGHFWGLYEVGHFIRYWPNTLMGGFVLQKG